MRKSSAALALAALALMLLAAVLWFSLWQIEARRLTVSFLDVGQGDAIFIQSPGGRQLLIDGGPDSSVLRALSAVMPWYDHSIDMILATHPDLDHSGGLMDVLSRYRVDRIMLSSVEGNTPAWHTFLVQVNGAKERGAIVTAAERGQIVDLGDGARLEVLAPDRPVPHVQTNVGCVVTRLVYGETSFMLPCDTTADVEEYLVQLDGHALHSNVLKAAHHGSKTSSAPIFVGFVDPEYAVYSRGCDNTYGHPHKETIATFARFNIPALDTCKDGTITFASDGKEVTVDVEREK